MATAGLRGLLITGATGQLGAELVRALASSGPIYTPVRAELDLAHPESIRKAMRSFRPRWVLNAAAYTAVDQAESDPINAFAINAEAVAVLAEAALEVGSAVIHFSTDYVFSGAGSKPYTEDDATSPINVYGASKLAGEQALIASGVGGYLFRTTWVFGATGKNFLRTILRLAREQPELRIVDDQFGAPTWSRDLARLARHAIDRGEANGPAPFTIYHAAGGGETSWHDFAQEALSIYAARHPNANLATLARVPTSAYPTAARRPLNSRFDCSRLSARLGWAMMDWRHALHKVMDEIGAGEASPSSAPSGETPA